MNKQNKQFGFGAVELLLALILLVLLVLTGLYVAHNYTSNKASSKSSNAAEIKKETVNIAQAVAWVNGVYANYQNEVIGGQVLTDKSQWAQSNPFAAADLQFMNKHAADFTHTFVERASNYETMNTTPPGGGFLICASGMAYFNNNSLLANGVSIDGNMAKLTITYTTGGASTGGVKNYQLPLIAKLSDANVWAIDSVDLSSCSQS